LLEVAGFDPEVLCFTKSANKLFELAVLFDPTAACPLLLKDFRPFVALAIADMEGLPLVCDN
jgi:hypothetical protein